MKLATAAGDQGLGVSRRQPVVAGGRLLKLRRRRRRKLSLFFSTNIYMTTSLINVPSQKFPVPKITMQSHNLNINVLSSVVDFSGDEV